MDLEVFKFFMLSHPYKGDSPISHVTSNPFIKRVMGLIRYQASAESVVGRGLVAVGQLLWSSRYWSVMMMMRFSPESEHTLSVWPRSELITRLGIAAGKPCVEM